MPADDELDFRAWEEPEIQKRLAGADARYAALAEQVRTTAEFPGHTREKVRAAWRK